MTAIGFFPIFQKRAIYEAVQKEIAGIGELEVDPDRKFDPQFIDNARKVHGALQAKYQVFLTDTSLLGRIKRCIAAIFTYLGLQPSNHDVEKGLSTLKFHIEAMAYRTGQSPKAQKNAVDLDLVEKYKKKVIEYKKSHPENYEPHQYRITGHDISQIRKICRYDTVAREFLNNREQLKRLFNFTIRNLFPVSCYMQFPQTTEKLHKNHVTSPIGSYHAVKLLKKLKDKNSIGLKFDHENRYVDLLREKEVNVTATLKVPLKTIFDDFASQGNTQGEYYLLGTGVTKWAIDKSWKEYVNPDSPLDWYMNLKEGVADVVSFGELKKVFKDFDFEEGDWIVSFATSRQSVERNIDKSHGFVRFYFPVGDGKYKVLSPGVFAQKWPVSKKDKFLFIGNTVPAVVCIPDPNHAGMPQRSKAETPRFIKKDDAPGQIEFQKQFKEFFLSKKIFQWGGENCAYQAEKLARACPKPHLILTHVSDVLTEKILWLWVKPYTLAPKFMSWYVLQCVLTSLGGHRSIDGKCLMNSEMAKSGRFNYPGTLHDLIRKRIVIDGQIVMGVIFGGHNRDYELEVM